MASASKLPGSRTLATGDDALLERESELSAIDALIARAITGQSGLAVVEGPAGIGKTRLLTEARQRGGERGLTVLCARCDELEREFAFGAVRQLFASAAILNWPQMLRGAAAPARAIVDLDDESAQPQPAWDPSFAVLHGLYWLTVHLSEDRPLLLALDDLHSCDSPSLRFLAYLTRRLEGLPVLLVCAMRSFEHGDEAAVLGAITGNPAVVPLRPRSLSEAATAELVQARLGESIDAGFNAACHRATGGNPLWLSELLKALQADGVRADSTSLPLIDDLGPQAVRRAVLLRLSRLPAEATTVAEAVAVLGDGADLATVARLAGLDEDRAGVAVAALAREDILRRQPPPGFAPSLLGFAHPLLAAAVHHDLLPGEREQRHRRAAELLAEVGAPVEQVAAHLLLAPTGGEARVVQLLREAAQLALRTGAADSAVAYLSRALREPPPADLRAQVLLELGRAEALTNGVSAVAHLGEAHQLLDDVRARASAAQLLGRVLLFRGQTVESADVARRAAAELPPELDDSGRALEALELTAALIDGNDDEALRRLRPHRAGLVGAGVGAKMLAALAVQDWIWSGGPSDACASLALQALAGGELIAADNGLLGVIPIIALTVADREEAVQAWEVSLAEAHLRGSLVDQKSVTMWRGFTMLWRGELAEAEESLRSYAEGRLWGIGEIGRRYADALLSAVLRERGDLVGARRALEGSTDPGDGSDATRFWLHSSLELLVAEGRVDEALAVAEAFPRRFAHIASPVDTPWRSPAVVALQRANRVEEARSLALQDLEQARAWGAPGSVARALRTLGTVEREHGLQQLHEAVELAASSTARLEHAKSLAVLGAALRRARRPTDARAPLRHALDIADMLGAEALAADVRSGLYATGARPRTSALTGVGSLTASERRVARLVAEGQANREVAERLFVSPKTVEMHLGNIYRKLGISSRRELPAELRR